MSFKDNDTNNSPNYIELDFKSMKKNTKEDIKTILPPPRLHHLNQQKQLHVPDPPPRTPAINHHVHIHHQSSPNHSARIHPTSIVSKNQISNESTTPVVHEDPRDFATFLCIFASVMTTVLVLMFYMVGEQAFRLILLVISFVSILTLCLACFLRRPTLVILGQTIPNNNIINTNNSNSIGYVNNNNDTFDKTTQAPQPYLLIFPTLFGQQQLQNHSNHQIMSAAVEPKY